MALPDDITNIPDIDAAELNQLQLEDYRDNRREVLTWLYEQGKDPGKRKGYSETVVENTAYRLSKIHRWIWDRDGYSATITRDHADAYVEELAYKDWGDENKNQCVKALKRYFSYARHEKRSGNGLTTSRITPLYLPGYRGREFRFPVLHLVDVARI